MILLVAAAVIQQQDAVDLTGAQVFSKMLAKYHDAKTIRGTVVFTQSTSTPNGTPLKVDILSSVQAQKPNLFFLEQTRVPKSNDPEAPNRFLGVSDGKRMTYSMPPGQLPWTDATSGRHSQLYETAPAGIEGGLNTFCTFLLDRSLPIACALYNPYEVQIVTDRLTNVTIGDKEVDLGGKPVYSLRADYILFYKDPRTGKPYKIPAQIYVDKQFNLVSLSWTDAVTDNRDINRAQVVLNVKSTWTVNLTVDGEVDKSLFNVR